MTETQLEGAEPIIRFYRMVPDGLGPMRADRAALGTLPTAAYQYCEPVCAASAFGWYVFPPIDFHVLWDGTDFVWTRDSGEEWNPVTVEHFPDLPAVFDAKAPDDVRGYAPPFLTQIPQPGVLQVWTGLLFRTHPGWSALVRPPANIARSQHYEAYEGIIEADRGLHPIFTNLRVVTSNRPIFFDRNKPLAQVQPLQRVSYQEKHLRTFDLTARLDDFTEADWTDYRKNLVERGKNPFMRPGRYATAARKRARVEDEDGNGGQ